MAASLTNEIFEKAHEEFLKLLTPEDHDLYSSCASAEELLAGAKKLHLIAKDRVRGRGFLERIQAFTDKLTPYFQVIEIMIQVKPEATSLLWRSIQLVLQLACTYSTFFDKLTRILETIARNFPQYELIVNLYKGSYPAALKRGIETSLRAVYADIFQFLHRVTRVFARKDGRLKHRPVVEISSAWQPFDSYFDDLLKRIESHCTELKVQLEIDQLRLSIKANKDMQEMREAELQILDSQGSKSRHNPFVDSLRESIERLEELKRTREEELVKRICDYEEKEDKKELERQYVEQLEEERHRHQDFEAFQKNSEEAQIEIVVARIQDWLSPPEYIQEFEKALESREDGTAEWLLEDPEFENWKDCESLRSSPVKFDGECLWIQGNPGHGKTTLAATTVSALNGTLETYQNQPSTSDSDVLYFFFRAGIDTMKSICQAYRSLLAQVLQKYCRNVDIIDRFLFAMNDVSGGQLLATKDELQELLQLFTKCYKQPCYFVLDGIDECAENASLVQDLLKLKQDSKAMFLLFSRPTVPLLFQAVPLEQQISVGRKTSADIKIYLERNLEQLQKEGLLEATADTGRLIRHLVTGADGLFLWARLMVSYLGSPALTSTKRVEMIREIILPERLEMMYERIGKLIVQGYQIERSLAKCIITWLAFAERKLTAQEMQAAISSTDDPSRSQYAKEDTNEFIHMVTKTCAGLVETEEIYSPFHQVVSTFFRFIHLSAQEYFANQENNPESSSHDIMSIIPQESHIEITRSCLYFLTFNMPAQPLGGNVGSNIKSGRLNDTFPFAAYAALYWVQHLQATELNLAKAAMNSEFDINGQLGPLLLSISRFLSQKYVLTSWIEAAYICEKRPSFEELKQWTTWAEPLQELVIMTQFDMSALRDDAFELVRYLKELDEVWGTKLMKAPGCIWEEVTAFTPCRLLPQTTAIKVHSLAENEPLSDYLSGKCLCKISESSQNGLLLGTLSIWPSRKYETFTQKKTKYVSLKVLRDLASGWVARYEIWSLAAAEPLRTVDHKIALDNTEVWLQMKQTLCQKSESGEGWGMQFPMAISKTVGMFTVLRTLFCMKPAILERGLSLESIVLSVDVDGSMSPHWSTTHDGLLDQNGMFMSDQLEADERFERRDLYLYWLSFHPNNRTVLFVSQDLQAKSKTIAYTICALPNLTAAAFGSGQLKVEGSLLRHQEWGRDFNQVQMIYHPQTALVGFSFAGQLFLWAFANSNEKPSLLCDIDPNPDVYFSSCGKYIYYSEQSERRLIKRPIPHRFLQVRRDIVTLSQPSPGTGAVSLIKSTSWRAFTPVGAAADSSTKSLSQPSFRADQAPLRAFRSHDNSLHVQPWPDRGNPHASREITKLPSWAGPKSANISVRIPQDREEMVKIILNKAPQPWYGMSKPADTHLPAFIQRDQRSLDLSGLAIDEPPRSRSALRIDMADSEENMIL